MKTVIVSCTQTTTTEEISKLEIVKSFERNLKSTCDFSLVTNNKQGLPKVYNEFLSRHRDKDTEWLVFVHDDVYIDDADLNKKLDKAYNDHQFNIVGLAGCASPTLREHNLWHIMASKENLHGHVAHPIGRSYNNEPQIRVTSFGPTPSRVTIVDGLFIAVHIPSTRDSGWKFNENYRFHHYDISSCIDANRAKLKIGVYPINVMHLSPGLRSLEDAAWSSSNIKFLKEYNVQAKQD